MRKVIFSLLSALVFCGAIYVMTSCSEVENPVPVIDDPEKESDVVITDTTVLETTILGAKSEIVMVNYTYVSVGADGTTPLKLSSALVFPKKMFERGHKKWVDKYDGSQYDATGLMLIPHFTIACGKEAPTQTTNMEVEGPMCVLCEKSNISYILVSPDFSGFGVDSDQPQAYMMGDMTAKQALDGLDAAKQALKTMGYTYGPNQVLAGYSQGGHTAMAIQRMLSRKSAVQPFELTCAGGGPHNLAGMVDSALKPGATTKYPCAIPLIFVESARAMGLNLDYNKIFHKTLSSKIVKWISGKQLTSSEINDSIYRVLGGDIDKGVKVSDILDTDYVNRSNPELAEFFGIMEDNTLTEGWKPISGSKFYLYHSKDDQVVPFFCYEHMCDFLKKTSGSDIDLESDDSAGSHQTAAIGFVMGVMVELMDLLLY